MSGNLRGSLLMVAAMAGFAVEDMFLKSAAKTLPVGLILMIFGFGGMVGFAVLALRRGERLLHPAILTRPILIRAVFEVAGRLFYTLAIAFTALSSASAILQATPLVVVAGAALVFGEKVGWRRWSAIAVGFVGVLIILRPGLEGFTVLSLLAVLGTLGFAGRDLATRAAPPVLTNLQLGVYGFAMMVPTGAVLLAFSGGAVLPGAMAAVQLMAATLVGVAAYYALTAAMRMGEVSVITPFRYTRLVFALILGATVFGERPDALTLTGSAVIVASGIYTLLRSRRPR
ncbi:MAG: DMT family transporter [Paracoccaceae bacterium]|nr:DMT family transporter [Paracoccaceae bacterium]